MSHPCPIVISICSFWLKHCWLRPVGGLRASERQKPLSGHCYNSLLGEGVNQFCHWLTLLVSFSTFVLEISPYLHVFPLADWFVYLSFYQTS